jgi:integrase
VSFFSWPNDPEPLPVVLSPAEVARLLAAMPTPAYRMLFCTMYASGLRILEACRLVVSDLDGDRGAIRV